MKYYNVESLLKGLPTAKKIKMPNGLLMLLYVTVLLFAASYALGSGVMWGWGITALILGFIIYRILKPLFLYRKLIEIAQQSYVDYLVSLSHIERVQLLNWSKLSPRSKYILENYLKLIRQVKYEHQ